MSKPILLFVIVSVVILTFILLNKEDSEKENIIVEQEKEQITLEEEKVQEIKEKPFVPENLPKVPGNLPDLTPATEPESEPETQPEPVTQPVPEPVPVKVSRIIITKKSSANRILSLAEVQLFNGDEQISIENGTATQSSTFDKNTAASKAIDGGNKFNINGKSVSSTTFGKDHWWKVVLKKPVDATKVRIYNTLDTLTHLEGAILKVRDEKNVPILEEKLTKNKIQTYDLSY